ncbi:MAG: hypothetical protein JRI47_10000 [Deltaproteobacteria bacterium]|nr:hypothetical protein [Deltaproteobacteria bacterium]
MNRFIGLDGHSASCTFVVLDEKGRVKRDAVIETNGIWRSYRAGRLEGTKTIIGMHRCRPSGSVLGISAPVSTRCRNL